MFKGVEMTNKKAPIKKPTSKVDNNPDKTQVEESKDHKAGLIKTTGCKRYNSSMAIVRKGLSTAESCKDDNDTRKTEDEYYF